LAGPGVCGGERWRDRPRCVEVSAMPECRHRRFPAGVILLRVCWHCKCGVLCRDLDETCTSAVSRPIQSSIFAGFSTPHRLSRRNSRQGPRSLAFVRCWGSFMSCRAPVGGKPGSQFWVMATLMSVAAGPALAQYGAVCPAAWPIRLTGAACSGGPQGPPPFSFSSRRDLLRLPTSDRRRA
jgi:hypothetical protein